MSFTPEQLEKKGYIVVIDGCETVICVQCPRCGNAVPSFAMRCGEDERIDGYDSPSYSECDCVVIS